MEEAKTRTLNLTVKCRASYTVTATVIEDDCS